MYKNLAETIKGIINVQTVSEERKTILQPLIDFVQQKANSGADIDLNFICTYNSRRGIATDALSVGTTNIPLAIGLP